MVPFVAALNRTLVECQLRSNRPRIATAMMTGVQAQFEADIKFMTDIALASTPSAPPVMARDAHPILQVVQQRRAHPTEPDAPKDLLDRMLTAVDAKTGEKMTDDSIVDNVCPLPL